MANISQSRWTTYCANPIIAILVLTGVVSVALTMVSALLSWTEKSVVAEVRRNCEAIETGLKAFYQEYKYWPADSDDPEILNHASVMDSLIHNPSNGIPDQYNKKGLVFIKPPFDKNKKTFDDPWGSPYSIAVDLNADGYIELVIFPQ